MGRPAPAWAVKKERRRLPVAGVQRWMEVDSDYIYYRNHGFGSYRNRRASSRSFSSSEMAVPASKTMVELLAFMLGIKIPYNLQT